jgi:sporulation protein YlmC with PRC-barrel domain
VSNDGQKLGRIYDLRVEREGDRLRLCALVVAKRGLWERLSGDSPGEDEIPWRCVSRIRDDSVVVDDAVTLPGAP